MSFAQFFPTGTEVRDGSDKVEFFLVATGEVDGIVIVIILVDTVGLTSFDLWLSS
jgi:hypothetical protein